VAGESSWPVNAEPVSGADPVSAGAAVAAYVPSDVVPSDVEDPPVTSGCAVGVAVAVPGATAQVDADVAGESGVAVG